MMTTTLAASIPDAGRKISLPQLDLFIEDCGTAGKTAEWPPDGDVKRCPRAGTIAAYDCRGDWWHLWETSCKTWHCSVCGPRKTRQLCDAVAKARPNRFVTLTTAGHGTRTPREVWNEARRQISELAKTFRRTHGEFEYCRVLEPHKSGYPHFHLIVRSPYIEKEELSRRWAHLSGAFIVDIRRINPARNVARYVAKYLTKCPKNLITERRVTQTRNFFEPPEEREPNGYHLAELRRFGTDLPGTAYWEFPNAEWEKETPYHWLTPGHRNPEEDDAEF